SRRSALCQARRVHRRTISRPRLLCASDLCTRPFYQNGIEQISRWRTADAKSTFLWRPDSNRTCRRFLVGVFPLRVNVLQKSRYAVTRTAYGKIRRAHPEHSLLFPERTTGRPFCCDLFLREGSPPRHHGTVFYE